MGTLEEREGEEETTGDGRVGGRRAEEGGEGGKG